MTVTYSTPTTSTLTTVVRISGPSSSPSPSLRSLSSVGLLTWPTTETVAEGVPKSESTSTSSTTSEYCPHFHSLISQQLTVFSSASKSQRQPSTPILVVIGLVVASFIAGIFFLLFCCRRRLRLRQKKVEHVLNRPESCLSFLGSDPFVSLPLNRASAMRSTGDEDQRGLTHPVLDAVMSNWRDSESVGHEAIVFDSILHKPKSLDNDSGTTLSSQYGTRRSSPCMPTTYPRIFFEQDEVTYCEGPSSGRYATVHETPTLIPMSHPPPPPRPPRSPRRKSKRSARQSFDSAHSSSASLLHKPSPEDRLEELYYGTTQLNVGRFSLQNLFS